MKRTLLVVLLALALVFAFATAAVGQAGLTLDMSKTYSAPDQQTPVTLTFQANGLTAGASYYVQSGESQGDVVTVEEGRTDATLTLEYLPEGGWEHTGANALGNDFVLMQKADGEGEDTEVYGSCAGSGEVIVGSSNTGLTVTIAPNQTGTNTVVSSGDSATIKVYTTLDAVKIVLLPGKDATLEPAASTVTLTSTGYTVTVKAQNGETKEYKIEYVKTSVVIGDPYRNSSLTTKAGVSGSSIAMPKADDADNKLYFQITGVTGDMQVVGAEKVTGKTDVYVAEPSGTSLTVSVKNGDSTLASETYTLVRPVLERVYMNDEDKTGGADKVTKFNDKNVATYTFDGDWDDLYFLPETINSSESHISYDVEVDGKDADDDGDWYVQDLRDDAYTIEIRVTASIGSGSSNEFEETYVIYVSNEEYEGSVLSSFTANDERNTRTPYLSFVGENDIYVFVPYGDRDEDIYFLADTGDKDDSVYYGSSSTDYNDEYYKGDADVDLLTVEDEYGFVTEYTIHVIVGEKNGEDDADLDDLALSTGTTSSAKTDATLSPAFKSSTTTYTAAVPSEHKHGKITFKTSDSGAYVFINGENVSSGSSKSKTVSVDLEKGANKFEIVVVAEDGEESETYNLTVNAGNNTQMKSLTVSGLSKGVSPAFSSSQMNYIGYTTASSVTISATAQDSSCSVTISGTGTKTGPGSASGSFNLAEGLNIFTVSGYQSGATMSSYTVSIYRIPDAKTIKVSQQKVTVNGTAKTLTAYNINGNNFLQLRDVATLLNGTSKSFALSFNDSTQTAYMTTGSAYVANGTENAAIHNYKRAVVSTQNFYLNNAVVYPVAFNIDGSNYVMLRDLGVLMNFGITFNGSTQTIAIHTDSNYVPGR